MSIITRTYNSATYIETALKSIFAQTINPHYYETILVDDGSKDTIKDVVKQYGKKIRPTFQEHLGFVRALNVGIKNVRTPYFIILDADDTFEPALLEKMHTATIMNPDAAYLYCDYYEHILETGRTKIVSTKENVFNCLAEGILLKTSTIEKFGLYNESLFFPEYDILIHLVKKEKGIHIPEPLFTYNRHAGSLTSKKERVEKGKKQLIEKHGNIPEINQIRDY